MANILDIDGSYFVIYDSVTGEEYERSLRADTTFKADVNDKFTFFFVDRSQNGQVEGNFLGGTDNTYDGTLLVDARTGSVFTSIAALKTFLGESIGFFFNPNVVNNDELIEADGVNNKNLSVYLYEIVTQLKINNAYLKFIIGDEVTHKDIDN